MYRFAFTAVAVLIGLSAWAQNDDRPTPDQDFTAFFIRLTRGGTFPGIRLNPPEDFKSHFLSTIRKGFWVGGLDRERRDLVNAGVDIWFDWYQTDRPYKTLVATAIQNNFDLEAAFAEQFKTKCQATSLPDQWSLWTICARSILADQIARWPGRSGKTLMDRVARHYGLTSQELLSQTEIFYESNAGFSMRAREMGYGGEIYFRGITGPNPRRSGGLWIVLNMDQIFERSSFSRPILQILEASAILTHELNHVGQELRGRKLGLDVQVRSAEGALLIEGGAEYLNEKAWIEFAQDMDRRNPFALFMREQAVEIVYREGNSVTGSLFPYTVGLPFAASMYSLAKASGGSDNFVTDLVLEFLGDRRSLPETLIELTRRQNLTF